MTKDETIEKLWIESNHGTQRKDIEAAYNAGAAAERMACKKIADNAAAHCEEHDNYYGANAAKDISDRIGKRSSEKEQHG